MTFRGFISLDVEPNDKIRRFMDDLEKTGAPLNMVGPNQIHMTIKFLGDTEEDKVDDIVEKVNFTLKEFDSFKIDIKGTGAFPHLGYMKVVWMGTEEETGTLKDIAHRVEEELVPLGFEREDREFSPHITVARVKGGKNKEQLRNTIENYDGIHFKSMKVNKLSLKKSILKKSGAEYTTLKEMYL
jgi:2'-5' RNA ligase